MSKKLLAWFLLLAALVPEAAPAMAGSRRAPCLPYTVEEACRPGWSHCELRMVYAPRQSPGVDRYAYWYPVPHRSTARKRHPHHAIAAKAAVRHAATVKTSRYVTTCTYRCWYRHPPEHGF